jgi:hypothetical protein
MKVEARFRHLEAGLAAEGRQPADAGMDELEARWSAAKTALKRDRQEEA